jgi:hypothetical protein
MRIFVMAAIKPRALKVGCVAASGIIGGRGYVRKKKALSFKNPS